MKILITGPAGFVGAEVIRQFLSRPESIELYGIVHKSANSQGKYTSFYGDITDKQFIQSTIRQVKPDVIIHLAAHSQADHCEENPVACRRINTEATGYIAEAAKDAGSFMIFLSSSFVFDGKEGPYKETDKTFAINEYGKSKIEAEKIILETEGLPHCIIRTVMVFGPKEPDGRHNIISKSIENLRNGVSIKIVNDQVRTPTYVKDLASFIVESAINQWQGIFHISGTESTTPYEMVCRAADKLGLDKSLVAPVSTAELNEKAQRPLISGFICDHAIEQYSYKPLSIDSALDEIFNA